MDTGPKVFISYRFGGESEKFAAHLSLFVQRELAGRWDAHKADLSVPRRSHTAWAATAIRDSDAFICVYDARGFHRAEGQAFQKQEVDIAFDEHAQRLNGSTPDPARTELPFILLVLQELVDGEWRPALDQLENYLTTYSTCLEVKDWSGGDWQDAVRRTLATIAFDVNQRRRQQGSRTAEILPDLVQRPSETRAPPGEFPPPWFTAYLANESQKWRRGEIGRHGRLDADRPNPCAFKLERFIDLRRIDVRRRSAPQDRDLKEHDLPHAIDIILGADPPVVFICGEAGAGKSTLLAVSAWMLHSVRTSGAADWPGFEAISQRLGPILKRAAIPLVVSAPRLGLKGPTDADLLAAIAAELAALSGCQVTAGDVKGLLNDTSVVLMIDGVDEAAMTPLLRSVEALSRADHRGRLKIVMSARAVDTALRNLHWDDVDVAVIERLDAAEISEFVARYGDALGPSQKQNLTDAVQRLRADLVAADSNRDVLQNPLMLSAACWVVARDHELPSKKAELCHALIHTLCGGNQEQPDRKYPLRRKLLRRIADAAQNHPSREANIEAVVEASTEIANVRDELEALPATVGLVELIEGRGKETTSLRFVHRMFQDYSLAEHIAEQVKFRAGWAREFLIEREQQLVDLMEAAPEFLSFLTVLASQGARSNGRALVEAVRDYADSREDERAAHIYVALLQAIVDDSALMEAGRLRRLVSAIAPRLSEQPYAWPRRARAELLVRLARLQMPPEQLLGVPLGWRALPSQLDLPDPRLEAVGAAPVLVAEFFEFLDAANWQDEDLWRHCSAPPVDRAALSQRLFVQGARPNCPVTDVTWYEAVAYCNWLADKEGAPVRLLTLQEWRAIARAISDGAYAFEGSDPGIGDDARVNWRGARVGRVSPIGLFAHSQVDPKLFDFGSNVYEWAWPSKPGALLQWPLVAWEGQEALLLGGSWRRDRQDMLIERKPITYAPSERSSEVGFRCVRLRAR